MGQHDFVVQDDRIHCESCEQRITNALGRLPGVREVHADHRTQEVRVEADDHVTSGQIRDRLGKIGFEAEPKAS